MTMMVMVMVFPIQRVMADERRLVYGEHQKIFWTSEGKHRVEIRPELSKSIESVTEASAVPSISTLSSTYHGWSHFCPPSHPLLLVFQHGNSLGISLLNKCKLNYEGPFCYNNDYSSNQ
jgi:hypothetical protein